MPTPMGVNVRRVPIAARRLVLTGWALLAAVIVSANLVWEPAATPKAGSGREIWTVER